MPMVKQQVSAAIGPPGVIEDSAWGKIGRGTWEARHGDLLWINFDGLVKSQSAKTAFQLFGNNIFIII